MSDEQRFFRDGPCELKDGDHDIAERCMSFCRNASLASASSSTASSKALDMSWIEVASSPSVPQAILEWGLGTGESSVLAMVHEHREWEAIIDDLAARKCVASLGVAVRGTLGIVLTAKQRGAIPSARAVLKDLLRSGISIEFGS